MASERHVLGKVTVYDNLYLFNSLLGNPWILKGGVHAKNKINLNFIKKEFLSYY